ncbi:sodium/proline symporter PutP [Anaerotruncus rubiinfantis]|uniref:sodium/proline symporter PutP n=1 Tax=Anaerotruncus rubiinfantis TaxID=1720200 RepID=UPI00083408DE|nr:sodium/proline symporter PutP [Anaerotruncus rubiinfantis]
MNTSQIMMLGAMVVYLIMIICVGNYFSKKNETSHDFYLGGRGMGPWVVAMSAEASDMSGWLMMGLPGLAYATGIADAGWTAIGLALGTYINWKLIALPLRNYTAVANNSITVPDYLSNRFHDKRKILMNVAALFIVIFFVVYTASGFVACGKVFVTLFNFPYLPSMLVSALVIILYTTYGGFKAVCHVDFVQGTVMFFALMIIVGIGVGTAGGFGEISANVAQYDGYLSMFSTYSPDGASTYSWITIASGLAWGLGYMGMPHILVRFMAIRNASELKKSRRIGTSWCVLSLAMAVLIGVLGRTLYPDALSGSATESVFIMMCKNLLTGGALPIIAGVMLCGVLGAQISTSDSQLLAASSAVAQNFYQGLIKKDATEKQIMKVSHVSIILIAGAACAFALNPDSSIFKIVSFAWAGFGGAFGPLILFSLYWKRTNLPGAIAGVIAGGVTVLVWKLLLSPLGGIFGLYELLPAFILSSLAIIIVSKLTAEPSAEIQKEFDTAKSMTLETK